VQEENSYRRVVNQHLIHPWAERPEILFAAHANARGGKSSAWVIKK